MNTYRLKIAWVRRITGGGYPGVAVATEGGDTRWAAPGSRAASVALGLKPGQEVELKTNRDGEIVALKAI